MNVQTLVALSIVLLTGCGPTRTAGTRGMSAKELAVLSIAQLPAEAHVTIHAIQFDGAGDEYKIEKKRDFYLRPGDHTASFTFLAHIPGPGKWFVPSGALTIPGPKNIPLGTFAAGKTYELAPTIQGFDKLLEGGSLSLVREKAK